MKERLLTHKTPSSGITMWKYVMMTMLMIFIGASDLLAQAPTYGAIECVCLENSTEPGNGQFHETIIITAPASQPWTIVSAIGFYDLASQRVIGVDPPAVPTLYPSGTEITEINPGQYRISGFRVESTLYSITFSNGTEEFQYESTSKICTYPDGRIIGDMGQCSADEADVVTYSVGIQNNRIVSINWNLASGGTIVSGQGTNSISVDWDGTVGVHEISVEGEAMTFDGQNSGFCDFDGQSEAYVSSEISPNLACNNNVNLSINGTCSLTVTPDMFLEAMEQHEVAYSLEITDTEMDTLVVGNVIGMEYINKQLQVAVIHECSGNSCWGFLTIEDKSIPALECGDDIIIDCNEDISPETIGFPVPATATVTPIANQDNTYNVTGYDGCSDVTLTYSQVIESNLCQGDFGSTIVRNWLVTDVSGNTSTCQQNISVMRGSLDDITFPESYDDVLGSNPSLNPCASFPKLDNGNPDPAFTGSPMGSFCMNVEIQYTDTNIEKCGETSFKVRRRWEVTNLCDNEPSLVHVQTITIEDNDPPVVTAPEEFQTFTNGLTCSASVDVPAPIIINECSAYDYIVLYKLRDESGDPFTNAITDGVIRKSDGTYTITEVSGDSVWIIYHVVDACDNITQAFTEVEIVDNEQPIPVCNLNTFVGLTEQGTAYAGYEAFDDGSWDPCGLEKIEVRRMENSACGETSVFGDEVKFCCDDVGNTVMVRLRVTDLSGNVNECMVEVQVQDNKAPEFTFCPADRTVDCESNLTNYSIFGSPTATDNCGVSIMELAPIENFTDCGSGTIIRRFVATDTEGNEVTCQQTITVESLSPFNASKINWPNNYTTNNGCPGLGIAPEMLPTANSVPVITADPCAQIAVDYEDVVFQWVEGFCFKVLRTWTVFDECQFDPTVPNSGQFTFTQTIAVRNTSAPTFVNGCNGENLEVTQLGNCVSRIELNATAEDDCDQQDIVYSYEIDLNNDGTVDISGNGNSINRTVDYGTHKVTFFATDECDNTGDCEQLVTVQDDKAPTPYCLGEVVTTLNEDGIAEIWASDFDNGSFDECSGNNNVIVAFNAAGTELARTYNCDSLTSEITELEIMVFVIDQNGNSDFCTSILKLQDNFGTCGFDAMNRVEVSGKVYTEDQTDVDEVEVMIMDMSTESPAYDMTDEIGAYAFDDIVMNNDYYLEPNRNTSYLEGVSTLDLVLIQRHILGLADLDSPYKVIAADINNSESVSAIDIVQLRKLVLGVYTELPNNTSWRFVDADQEFFDVQDPFPFAEKIELDQLDQDRIEANFIGVKVGDVNGTYQSNAQGTAEASTRSIYTIKTIDATLVAGEAFTLPLSTTYELNTYGLQMTIEFDADKVSFAGYSGSDNIKLSDANIGLSQVHKGQVSIAYDQATAVKLSADELFIELTFIANESTKISDIFTLSERSINAEIYTDNGGQIKAHDISLDIENRNGVAQEIGFQLMQNAPNPFDNNTTISFILPDASIASLKVFDYTGRLLHEHQDEFQKGYNQIELDITDIDAQGILYYQLDTKTHSASKKMIVIR